MENPKIVSVYDLSSSSFRKETSRMSLGDESKDFAILKISDISISIARERASSSKEFQLRKFPHFIEEASRYSEECPKRKSVFEYYLDNFFWKDHE